MFPVSDLAEETMEQECLFKDDMGMKIWEFRHSFVSRLINSQQIKSVLDLGCSTGTLLQRLSRSNKI